MGIWDVIQNVGSVGIIAWLFKILIKYWIDKGIEKYKSTLQLESQSYKYELERIANERSIKFSKLHEDRARVIKEFYAKLFKLDTSVRSFLSPLQMGYEPSLTEKIKEVGKNFNKTAPYYYENKLYFDNDTCKLIENILTSIRKIFITVTSYPIEYDDPMYKYNDELSKEKRELMDKSWQKMTGDINSAKEQLEESFREMLGVS